MQSLNNNHTFIYQHRVSYAETDKMQFLHHSNYARIYENARWEFFRSLNIPYSAIEKEGIMMPVINMEFKFIKPAFYDELLQIEVSVKELSNVKLSFQYKTIKDDEIINEAIVTLAFMNTDSGKATRIPEFIRNTLNKE